MRWHTNRPLLMLAGVPLLAIGCVADLGTGPCGGGPSCWDLGDIPLGSFVDVRPDTVLAVGDSVQFTATYTNLDTHETSNGPFTWASRDPDVLTIDDGLGVGGLPGRTELSVRHGPTGTAHYRDQLVVIGDAVRDTVEFAQVGGSCGVDSDGRAHCWGQNLWGVLGIGLGTAGARATPTAVVGEHRFVSVHTSSAHRACGLRSDGAALCWGNNEWGRLGIGEAATGLEPTEVAGGLHFRSIHVGHAEICGVTTSDDGYCWAVTPNGIRNTPTHVGGDMKWAALAAGHGGHTCGIDLDGIAFCWGANTAGQLGNGTRIDRTEPARVAGDRSYTDIAIGLGGTCAITDGGALYCWGMGLEPNETSLEPEVFGPARNYRQLSASGWQMCVLADDGSAWCWHNYQWEAPVTEPKRVPGNVTFASVAAGPANACGIGTDGRVYCWGENSNGELGNGSFEKSEVPVAVVRPR